MSLGITLKNYRCFPDDQPAHFKLEKGFTALVGSNNSGKSTLLKFFWEFRHLLKDLSSPSGNLIASLQGSGPGLNFPAPVSDPEEIFSNRNKKGLTIDFDMSEVDFSEYAIQRASGLSKLPFPSRVIVDLERTTKNWSTTLYLENNPLPPAPQYFFQIIEKSTVLSLPGQNTVDLTPVLNLFQKLHQCFYVPAYRNAINAGTVPKYFDIQTGQAFITQWDAWQAGGNKGAKSSSTSPDGHDSRYLQIRSPRSERDKQ